MLGVTTQTFTIREVVGNNWHIKKRFFRKRRGYLVLTFDREIYAILTDNDDLIYIYEVE